MKKSKEVKEALKAIKVEYKNKSNECSKELKIAYKSLKKQGYFFTESFPVICFLSKLNFESRPAGYAFGYLQIGFWAKIKPNKEE